MGKSIIWKIKILLTSSPGSFLWVLTPWPPLWTVFIVYNKVTILRPLSPQCLQPVSPALYCSSRSSFFTD